MKHLVAKLSLLAALAGAAGVVLADDTQITYLHNLADFSGIMQLSGRIHVDPVQNEIFVLDGNRMRIFTPSGMESYSFLVEANGGWPVDFFVENDGHILIVTSPATGHTGTSLQLLRCDYRGVVEKATDVRLPDEYSAFRLSFVAQRAGRLFLVEGIGLRMVELRADGGFVRGTDLLPLLLVEEKERMNTEIGGVAIDADGRFLMTVSVSFRVFMFNPDLTPAGSFGVKGSGPGKFGVINAITTDPDGNIYVADSGRSMVLMFDKSTKFVTEFGGYSDAPQGLIRPSELAFTPTGHLLVEQRQSRGISVFDIKTTRVN